MIVDSPWSDQSLFVEEKAAPPRLDVMAPGRLWKHLCMASVVASGEVMSCHGVWDGYGMDGSCHGGTQLDGSISSQGPMALWTGPSWPCLCWGQHLWESILAKSWRPYFWDGRIDYYQVDFILEMGHLSSKNGVHQSIIQVSSCFYLTDGRSNLWSRGCFKASQGKFTANQSCYSQTNKNQNKSISKVPPPHTHTDMYAMHKITYIYICIMHTSFSHTHT